MAWKDLCTTKFGHQPLCSQKVYAIDNFVLEHFFSRKFLTILKCSYSGTFKNFPFLDHYRIFTFWTVPKWSHSWSFYEFHVQDQSRIFTFRLVSNIHIFIDIVFAPNLPIPHFLEPSNPPKLFKLGQNGSNLIQMGQNLSKWRTKL